jgi:hypothetical protein
MTVVAERRELERFGHVLDTWTRSVRRALEEAPLAQRAVVQRWARTVHRLSATVDDAVPPSLDPAELAEIRGDLLAITQSVLMYDAEKPLDSYEEALLRLEAIRHVVRDALDQRAADESNARGLVVKLEEALPRIGRRELAHLLGISERSIQRMLAEEDQVAPSRRLLLVSRLVALLRRGWTPEGVVAWFDRPRTALGGKTPLDVIDDAALEQEVLALARAGRAQHGS